MEIVAVLKDIRDPIVNQRFVWMIVAITEFVIRQNANVIRDIAEMIAHKPIANAETEDHLWIILAIVLKDILEIDARMRLVTSSTVVIIKDIAKIKLVIVIPYFSYFIYLEINFFIGMDWGFLLIETMSK